HLCHWTAPHLFWDLLVFVIAGSLAERRLGRDHYLPALALAGAAIGVTVFLLMPSIKTYRGLSGIDTFLYTFVALDLIRASLPNLRRTLRPFALLPLLFLFGKFAREIATGQTLFAGSLGENVIPLP